MRAREASAEEIFLLLKDADPDLVRALLKNPRLTESHLLSLLKRPGLPEGVVRAVARAPQGAGSRRVKIALARHPGTPPPLLAELLGQLHLFELVSVLRLPGGSPDHKAAAQQALLKRLPETEPGTRVALARQGSAKVLEALLADQDPRVVAAALGNPSLGEPNLLGLLRLPGTSAETISALLRHPRWGMRPKLRLAALRNRNTPAIWFTLLLPEVPTGELFTLAALQGIGPRQLKEVQEELDKRQDNN